MSATGNAAARLAPEDEGAAHDAEASPLPEPPCWRTTGMAGDAIASQGLTSGRERPARGPEAPVEGSPVHDAPPQIREALQVRM